MRENPGTRESPFRAHSRNWSSAWTGGQEKPGSGEPAGGADGAESGTVVAAAAAAAAGSSAMTAPDMVPGAAVGTSRAVSAGGAGVSVRFFSCVPVRVLS